jgi:hypothetical protein
MTLGTLHRPTSDATLRTGLKHQIQKSSPEINMKFAKLAVTVCALGFLSISSLAQDKPGTIAGIELQTPKNGMVKQYEDGRKAKIEWHKQQKDTVPLFVSEILSGEHTGSYLVGRFGMHWADMDKPSVTDAADLAQYTKAVAPYVEKLTSSYYEFLPKWSNPSPDMSAKYIEVTIFHVKYGKGDDFRSAVSKVHEANQKLNYPVHSSWYRLVDGGPGGTYVLTVDHPNWASFEDDPAIKPLRDRLREAFGEQESMSVVERLNGSIEGTYSYLIQPRPDLSYFPGK